MEAFLRIQGGVAAPQDLPIPGPWPARSIQLVPRHFKLMSICIPAKCWADHRNEMSSVSAVPVGQTKDDLQQTPALEVYKAGTIGKPGRSELFYSTTIPPGNPFSASEKADGKAECGFYTCVALSNQTTLPRGQGAPRSLDAPCGPARHWDKYPGKTCLRPNQPCDAPKPMNRPALTSRQMAT